MNPGSRLARFGEVGALVIEVRNVLPTDETTATAASEVDSDCSAFWTRVAGDNAALIVEVVARRVTRKVSLTILDQRDERWWTEDCHGGGEI